LISGSEIKTDNPKIYKANESFIQPDQLGPILEQMKESISNYDNNRILNMLAENVEGFER
jgi:FlaA1/EpsC-like NDP-sugar epimerase